MGLAQATQFLARIQLQRGPPRTNGMVVDPECGEGGGEFLVSGTVTQKKGDNLVLVGLGSVSLLDRVL